MLTCLARCLMYTLALPSGIAWPTEYFQNGVVRAEADRCKVEYSDSSVSILISGARGGKKRIYLDDKTGTSVRYWAAGNSSEGEIEYRQGEVEGKVEGQQEDILRKFSAVFPFAHIIDKILSTMQYGMIYRDCANLVIDIEKAAPRGFKLEQNWIRDFVDEHIDEAFSLTAKFGTYVDIY